MRETPSCTFNTNLINIRRYKWTPIKSYLRS
jgi:hypothetical protein